MSQAAIKMIDREPAVSVGLMTGVETAIFELRGTFNGSDGSMIVPGNYQARCPDGRIEIVDAAGNRRATATAFRLTPKGKSNSFVIREITIGIDFHWQRKQDQEFQGGLLIETGKDGRLIIINVISVEAYLSSVISSEMSAAAHPELLKAHSIISRSWLLAQLKPWKREGRRSLSQATPVDPTGELIRWYDQESHTEFDVCADDHCQRYQGITRATSPAVFEAVRSTFGRVLTFEGSICDARFSKSCGGMTESYDSAWEDISIPYLAVNYDGEQFPGGYDLPLTVERNAERWIRSSPPAFCHPDETGLLNKILPDFDQETVDYYRWQVVIEQRELQELLHRKLGTDFGEVSRLEPVARGGSGRMTRLRIAGQRQTLIIGKELEIRRALSPSHLYSSAFVIETVGKGSQTPDRFILTGAGWGHGVGLCQIGAALMAERNYLCSRILAHYYRGTQLQQLYEIEFD